MNYLTLLVILASLSVFFTLQAIYWIAKSRRDKRSALLDQRLVLMKMKTLVMKT